jgi:hypothetical protein
VRRAACVLGLVAACGGAPRFKDQPVVWTVDDRRDIAMPREVPFRPKRYFADVLALRQLTRLLQLKVRQPAKNTNALDELPDSTWFTNRIGRRPLSPEEAADGPGGGPPQPPYQVTRGKSEGGNPGFFMTDATGRRFLVKFDPRHYPEMQTSASVIVGRCLWALGYNVPRDHVFVFRREELTIAPDAKISDALKRKRPLRDADLDAVLATSPRTAGGAYRASSSELLEGTPAGGLRPEGTRPDDPNDRVAHEHRRELRALRVFAAWLGHTDVKEDNFLDMYVTEDGRRFLRHYLVDFGEALGGHQAEKGLLEDGWEYVVDWEMNVKSLLALGLWRRPWEGQALTPWPSVGYFAATHFDPRGWREAYPFWPFDEMDAADAYWGAKLVMRFDRPLLEAIVSRAQLSDPAPAAYIVDTLLARRDAIGRAYLDDVTAVDELELAGGRLCGVDLVARHALGRPGVLELLDGSGGVKARAIAAVDGRVCVPVATSPGYHVARLRLRRAGREKPVMQVHHRDGQRILGVIRVE